MKKTKILILAAGNGKRMGGEVPKVLTPLAGKPLIHHLLDNIRGVADVALVVGYKSEEVMRSLGGAYDFIIEPELLGTGHAVLCAKTFLEKNNIEELIVLYGDHPFIQKKSIENLLEEKRKNSALIALLTTKVENFEDWRKSFLCWGRVLRDNNGVLTVIREYKDSSEKERTTKEVNPGIYCFNTSWLWPRLEKIKNNNAQKEYYLTDVVEMAMCEGIHIPTGFISPEECFGINSPEELLLAEKLFINKK